MWQYPRSPRTYQLLWYNSVLAGDHLVVPIGVSHNSLRHKKYNRVSERKRTKNKRTIWAWVNSSARRLSCDTLYSLCICRLSLMCNFFCEISTSHEESWLILSGLPSLLLDPISCRLVSSAVRCRLPTALYVTLRQLLLWDPSSNFSLSRVPWPTSGLLVSRQNRQRDRLLNGPPT